MVTMWQFLMNAVFGRRKAQAFEVRRMPVGFELGSERRWITLSDKAWARLATERKAAR